MRTPLILVALVLFLIGISLVSSYEGVKASANDMTSTIFEPVKDIANINTMGSFDPEKYQQEAFFKTGVFMKDWFSFERDLALGVTAILSGLGLFIVSTLAGERSFWKNVVEFFT